MPFDPEFIEMIERYANADPAKIRGYVDTDPDDTLDTFLESCFGIKRMLLINSDPPGKEHVLRVLKKFAETKNLDYQEFSASKATVDDVRGEIESVFMDGKPYHRRKAPVYWPQEKRKMIVVDGINHETDVEVLRAFLYVACKPSMGNLMPDQLPEGSGFVFLSNDDFPVERFASITNYFREEFRAINWPPPAYSKDRTIYETRVAMKDVGQLYQKPFINWRGKTRDEHQAVYTEIIAEELLQSDIAHALQKLSTKNKRKNYYVATHNGLTYRQTNRKEEILAKDLFTNYGEKSVLGELGELGTIFDYQVPLKSVRGDQAGKIDLVSFNQKTNKIWLLELKKADNKDTLLRCVLEIATYYQLLDKDSFIGSYAILKGMKAGSVCKAVLVFKNSRQHQEIMEMKEGKRPKLQQLAKLLEISFFLLEKVESGDYKVEQILP